MKIISKFKDYYDYTSGYGFDPKKVYSRKTEEILLDENLDVLRNRWKSVRGNTQVIGFCGKIYPFNNLLDINLLSVKYSDKVRNKIIMHGDEGAYYYCERDRNEDIDWLDDEKRIIKEIDKRIRKVRS